MALIKCPECSKDVSTAADTCPHCGYPIRRNNANIANGIENQFFPEPKDISWVEKWKKKARMGKLFLLIPLGVSAILLTVFIILACTDLEVSRYGGTHSKPLWLVFMIFFAVSTLVTFILFIVSLFLYRIRTRQYDGYTIMVYMGFKQLLVVEDVLQDTAIMNRYLYGVLPNKKNVWVSISAWDSSVKMGVGEPGDEKNIIL